MPQDEGSSIEALNPKGEDLPYSSRVSGLRYLNLLEGSGAYGDMTPEMEKGSR